MPDTAWTPFPAYNSLSIRNFVAGHPCRFFQTLFNLDSLFQRGFQLIKKLILYLAFEPFHRGYLCSPIISRTSSTQRRKRLS